MSNEKYIEALEDYIEFLGEHVDNLAVYLHMHNMGPSEEDINKGKELRARIKDSRKNNEI